MTRAAMELVVSEARWCEWGAYRCQREAQHSILVRFHEEPVTMCDRCAAIFDPTLGALGGYVHDFIERTPVGLRACTAAIAQALLGWVG